MTNPNFVFIIEGEVAGNFKFPAMGLDENGIQIPMPPSMEEMMAIFQSNPVIIQTVDEIPKGSMWDGENFTPPTE
jgi:hypothetical protein